AGHELERELDLIDLAEQQIARLEAPDGGTDRTELTRQLDDARRALRARKTFTHQANHFAVGAPARALILVNVNLVEEVAEDLRLANDVLVAAIARGRVHDLAPAVTHAANRVRERDQRRGVVAVIEDHGAVAVRDDVEATRRRAEAARERLRAEA